MISEKEYLIVILPLFLVMVLVLYFYPNYILSSHQRLRAIIPTDTEWGKHPCREVYIQSNSIETPDSSDNFLSKK